MNNNLYLVHYGTKGMKWGVRRVRDTYAPDGLFGAKRYKQDLKAYRQSKKDLKNQYKASKVKSKQAYKQAKLNNKKSFAEAKKRHMKQKRANGRDFVGAFASYSVADLAGGVAGFALAGPAGARVGSVAGIYLNARRRGKNANGSDYVNAKNKNAVRKNHALANVERRIAKTSVKKFIHNRQ